MQAPDPSVRYVDPLEAAKYYVKTGVWLPWLDTMNQAYMQLFWTLERKMKYVA